MPDRVLVAEPDRLVLTLARIATAIAERERDAAERRSTMTVVGGGQREGSGSMTEERPESPPEPRVHHHIFRWSEVKAARAEGRRPKCRICGEAPA